MIPRFSALLAESITLPESRSSTASMVRKTLPVHHIHDRTPDMDLFHTAKFSGKHGDINIAAAF